MQITNMGTAMKDANLIKNMLVIFIATLQMVGCTDIQSVKPDTGEGTKITIYRRSYDDIWNAAIDVTGSRLTIIESDKRKGIIKAEAKESTFGEVVGIFIKPNVEGKKKYVVEVLTFLKYRPQVPGQDSEPVIINELKSKLEL